MKYLKTIILVFVVSATLAGCATMDQKSYDRQNKAAEKSQNSL